MTSQQSPKAFISCSLRADDSAFVNLVVAITRKFGFDPMGTVGKYAASPTPIWQQMRNEIASADCIIVAATPRYLQQDLADKNKTGKGISEMLHTEIGMAVMSGRPVMAFVLEGTDVGGFLPQTTQFIELRLNDQIDLNNKWPMIANYFRSALTIIQERWRIEKRDGILMAVGAILAGIGAAAVIDAVLPDDDNSSKKDGGYFDLFG